jgi:hypothetical protein
LVPAPERVRSPAAALRAFIDFEEHEHLFERKLLGVEYWQLIRHDVFRETLEALGQSARAHLRLEELPMRQWLGPQLRALPSTFQRSLLARLPQADLLVATHPRQLLYRGRYICPYTQPLLWGTACSRVLLTGHYQGRYFNPDAGEETRYVDFGLVRAHAAFRARELVGRGLSELDLRELSQLSARLCAQLGAAPDASALIRRARTAVLTSLGTHGFFEALLARVQPRLIVNTVGYRLVHQLLTLRARAHGIPVAEVQHGTIGAAHAGYTFARGRIPPAFPDHLLLFGDIWRDLTPGLPLPATQVHAIGYGWLELQRSDYPRGASATPRRVLFLSQRDIGRELAAVAAELRAQLDASQFELIYRLHPSEAPDWQERYPQLVQRGIRVELAQARPLYAAQAEADAQVGVYSTALVEGVAFGLHTCVVALPGHEQMKFLYERGLASRIKGAAELRTALQAPPNATRGDGTALWAANPQARFAEFVSRQLQPARRP